MVCRCPGPPSVLAEKQAVTKTSQLTGLDQAFLEEAAIKNVVPTGSVVSGLSLPEFPQPAGARHSLGTIWGAEGNELALPFWGLKTG